MEPQPVILASMAVAVIDSSVGNLQRNPKSYVPPSRIIFGGFIITIGLLIGSEINGQVAEALAILIVLGSIFGPTGGGLAHMISHLSTTDLPRKASQ